MVETEKIIEVVKRTKPFFRDREAVGNIRVKGLADYATQVDDGVQKFLAEELKKMSPELKKHVIIAGDGTEVFYPLAEKLREYTRMYGRLHDCGEINYGHNTVVPREYCEKMPAHKNGTNCLFGCCGISRFSR